MPHWLAESSSHSSEQRARGTPSSSHRGAGPAAADAEAMYEVTVTGYYEAGFDAVFGYVMNNPYAHTWMRNDAALLIVFVSDEEEQSKEYFNSTTQFLNWASNVRNSVFIASIVNFHPDVS